MRSLNGLALSAVLLTAPLPAAAGGSSLALALHTPPRLRPAAGESAFSLGAGWASLSGPGLSLSGPGGGWELASVSAGGMGVALHSEGYALGGTADPSGAGRLNAVGMAGSIEGDLVWAPGGVEGPWRLYLGLQAALGILDLAGPRSIVVPSGSVVEPSGTYSLLAGFPAGASVGGTLGKGWTGQAGAHIATYAGGVTIHRYFLRGTHLHRTVRRHSPYVAGGGHLRAEYAPWRLGLEAGGTAATRSGDSRGLAAVWTQASWRFR